MIGQSEAWQERTKQWAPAFVFFAVNVVAFSFYLMTYAGESKGVERRLGRAQGELAGIEQRVGELENRLGQATETSQNVTDFYEVKLATEAERLTAIIAEVKRLAQLAGLEPRRISYPTEEIAGFGLMRRSISFPVSGTYAQLRKMINLLELSDYFLTLRQVQLREADDRGVSLRIQLDISALFAMEPGPGGAPRERRGAELMSESKRTQVMLGVLGLLSVVFLWRQFGGNDAPAQRQVDNVTRAQRINARGRRAATAQSGRAGGELVPLELARLEHRPAEYSPGRDLFQYSRDLPKVDMAPKTPEPVKKRAEAPKPERAKRPPKPKPPPIDVEFLGSFGPAGRKIAVFMDNNDILNALEGDVLNEKFIVGPIGYESVEMRFVGFPDAPPKRIGAGS